VNKGRRQLLKHNFEESPDTTFLLWSSVIAPSMSVLAGLGELGPISSLSVSCFEQKYISRQAGYKYVCLTFILSQSSERLPGY